MVATTRSRTGTPIKKPKTFAMENSSAPNIPSPLRKSIKATTASSASPSAKTQTSASSVAAAAATKLDKEVVFEFGGPFGVSVMMVLFPFLMYYFWFCIEFHDGHLTYPTSVKDIFPYFLNLLQHVRQHAAPNTHAIVVYLGYVVFSAILSMTMPGPIVKGLPVPSLNFNRLDYLCNGVSSFYLTLVTSAVLHYYRILPLSSIIDNFAPIMTVAVVTGFAVSFAVYLSAFITSTTHRMSGYHAYDFFMGAPLNPRIWNLDLKMWAEIRVPWIILFYVSLSAAVKCYETQGTVPPAVAFMLLAHFLYVNACMKGEECIPTTWDVFYEKDGFMLIFWNLAGVPFTYCYSTLYLLKSSTGKSTHFHHAYYAFLFVTLIFAYYVWDTANSQKNRFRMQQSGTYIPRWTFPQLPWGTLENPTFVKTKNGSLLLTAGWWGYARKIHYTADLVMALSWGLVTGFDSIIPYFYVVFFLCVLTHRVSRDMERCGKKYGKDWETYCKQVPWIFIPGIY